MNESVNPDMITLAREIRRLTQTQLAKASGINQGNISRYEAGIKPVSTDDLSCIAVALDFPDEFFFQAGMRLGAEPSEIFHRKRRSLPVKDRKCIDGLLNLHRIGATRLLNAFEQKTTYSVPTLSIDDFDNIDEIAETVRWNMPHGPVNDLVGWLEQASCVIFSHDFQTDLIDEAVQWIAPSPPIILLNSAAPADRVRFSLAHALGHLVMHHNVLPYEAMEKEADQFAAAFLMPKQDILGELIPVTVQHMLELKQSWKVSMQALMYRARDLEVIYERQFRWLFQQINILGYRKREPLPIPHEKPLSIKTLLDCYKNQQYYSDEELAKLLRIRLEDYYKWYYPLDEIWQF